MKTHISQFEVKSAKNIAAELTVPEKDTYHENILKAATLLDDTGRGDLVYQNQWQSGTTVWIREFPFASVLVDDEGTVLVR